MPIVEAKIVTVGAEGWLHSSRMRNVFRTPVIYGSHMGVCVFSFRRGENFPHHAPSWKRVSTERQSNYWRVFLHILNVSISHALYLLPGAVQCCLGLFCRVSMACMSYIRIRTLVLNLMDKYGCTLACTACYVLREC